MNIYYIIINNIHISVNKGKKKAKKNPPILYIYSVTVVAAAALPKLGEEGKEK